jgi:S-methylmethionine-dependent homocysteine/selenocysteine methylase
MRRRLVHGRIGRLFAEMALVATAAGRYCVRHSTRLQRIPIMPVPARKHTSRYRNRLPQLESALFLTDGGLETTLVFQEGLELPCFAAFPLLFDARGSETLRRYFLSYIDIARRERLGIVLESPTWRANRDWGVKLGYEPCSLEELNRMAIGFLLELRVQYETAATPIVISGNIGPRGDGYRADSRMSVAEAEAYHSEQMHTFADTDADMVGAFTMNYPEEAIGIARAARAVNMPLALSFTVETDGHLPSGDSLAQAMRRVERESDAYPTYYMINCAHPAHFERVIGDLGSLARRVRGLRANASRLSHAELDACTTLDSGNPAELGAQYAQLKRKLPELRVVGGCCGTDHRHVAQIARSMAKFSGSGAQGDLASER